MKWWQYSEKSSKDRKSSKKHEFAVWKRRSTDSVNKRLENSLQNKRSWEGQYFVQPPNRMESTFVRIRPFTHQLEDSAPIAVKKRNNCSVRIINCCLQRYLVAALWFYIDSNSYSLFGTLVMMMMIIIIIIIIWWRQWRQWWQWWWSWHLVSEFVSHNNSNPLFGARTRGALGVKQRSFPKKHHF